MFGRSRAGTHNASTRTGGGVTVRRCHTTSSSSSRTTVRGGSRRRGATTARRTDGSKATSSGWTSSRPNSRTATGRSSGAANGWTTKLHPRSGAPPGTATVANWRGDGTATPIDIVSTPTRAAAGGPGRTGKRVIGAGSAPTRASTADRCGHAYAGRATYDRSAAPATYPPGTGTGAIAPAVRAA